VDADQKRTTRCATSKGGKIWISQRKQKGREDRLIGKRLRGKDSWHRALYTGKRKKGSYGDSLVGTTLELQPTRGKSTPEEGDGVLYTTY